MASGPSEWAQPTRDRGIAAPRQDGEAIISELVGPASRRDPQIAMFSLMSALFRSSAPNGLFDGWIWPKDG